MLLFPNAQSIYLENKHLSSKHCNCVKVPFTDIRSIVIWSFGGPGAVRLPRRCLWWPRLWTTGCHGGKSLSGATVWLTCRKKQTQNIGLPEGDKESLKNVQLEIA